MNPLLNLFFPYLINYLIFFIYKNKRKNLLLIESFQLDISFFVFCYYNEMLN
jgi:hypothetical protein